MLLVYNPMKTVKKIWDAGSYCFTNETFKASTPQPGAPEAETHLLPLGRTQIRQDLLQEFQMTRGDRDFGPGRGWFWDGFRMVFIWCSYGLTWFQYSFNMVSIWFNMIYPLVNVHITMENHHILWVNQL